ncbi:MAG TPA: polysaccharide deacetylase family protein [Azospira sp.]|nr:polysaccharide deacetylase family protein [Azospira sp.]
MMDKLRLLPLTTAPKGLTGISSPPRRRPPISDRARDLVLRLINQLYAQLTIHFSLGIAILLVSSGAMAGSVGILAYHRFGPEVADSMTVRTAVFEAQVARLRQEGYTFLPLSQAVAGLQRQAPLPDKAVAITVDDGHRSVYTELLPILRREHLPVALFIYPSAISNVSYAMTWEQLAELQATGLVEIHSHTYWHPNFHVEKKRLAPEAYAVFVRNQLEKPRRVLQARLGVATTFLAWPFGIYDTDLEAAAAAAGYTAAFTLDARPASPADRLLALPRYLMVDTQGASGPARLLRQGHPQTGNKKP